MLLSSRFFMNAENSCHGHIRILWKFCRHDGVCLLRPTMMKIMMNWCICSLFWSCLFGVSVIISSCYFFSRFDDVNVANWSTITRTTDKWMNFDKLLFQTLNNPIFMLWLEWVMVFRIYCNGPVQIRIITTMKCDDKRKIVNK